MAAEEPLEHRLASVVLDDFAERTRSDYSLVLEPLGDGVGWRVSVVTSTEILLGKASDQNVFRALDLSVTRALDNLARALESADDGEDDEADDRA